MTPVTPVTPDAPTGPPAGTLSRMDEPDPVPPPRHAGPPPRAVALSGWVLLPLRAFLGFTFTFAGLQKLANPGFFSATDPSGIQAQLIASDRLSPLHDLTGHLLRFATPIGVLIALAEVAVGLGTLLGLWSRVAALGGAVLSLTLFLTVSFHASPYYTGADIVFLFAWLPMIVAGSGGVLSLDGLIAARARRQLGAPPPALVAVPFATVQTVCGQYQADGGRCRARHLNACRPAGCPFLAGSPAVARAAAGVPSAAPQGEPAAVTRRRLVLGGAAVAAVGAAGLALAGSVAAIGRAVGSKSASSAGGGPATLGSSGGASSSTSSTPATTAGTRPAGTDIGAAGDVPVGGWARFTVPVSGDPGLLIRLASDRFVAYDAVCPHAGCTVGYSEAAKLIVCPCHGSEFEPDTGARVAGPAPHGLGVVRITEATDGQLYVD